VYAAQAFQLFYSPADLHNGI